MEKLQQLINYTDQLLTSNDKAQLYQEYKDVLENVTPFDVFEFQSKRLASKDKDDDLVHQVGLLMNLFYKPLTAYPARQPKYGGFLWTLASENEALIQLMTETQAVVASQDLETLKERIEQMGDYDTHMKKLENILFPVLERKHERYVGTSIMWSLNDQARASRKRLLGLSEWSDLVVELGLYYQLLSTLTTAQKLILLPCACVELSDQEDFELLKESFEYGFSFIEAPQVTWDNDVQTSLSDGVVDLGTGRLNVEQLVGIFSHLPVDMTFVDAQDKVAFFSRPKDRIFARSVSVIGRDVRKCHPSGSVHIVEEILSGFKSGARDVESFWIQMRGKFILIQYFAVRNEAGEYLGCLEVSQEVSEIRSLTGEKRLLDR